MPANTHIQQYVGVNVSVLYIFKYTLEYFVKIKRKVCTLAVSVPPGQHLSFWALWQVENINSTSICKFIVRVLPSRHAADRSHYCRLTLKHKPVAPHWTCFPRFLFYTTIKLKGCGPTICAILYLYSCASRTCFLFMLNIKVKAACSCKTEDEKPGVMFAATVRSYFKYALFTATEAHACSFARGDWWF